MSGRFHHIQDYREDHDPPKKPPINEEPVVPSAPNKGDDGLPGIRGPRGPKGDRGEQGSRGDEGKRGERGERGLQGLHGLRGERGEYGEQGAQGSQGEAGAEGPQGLQGERGLHGLAGQKGEKGERGDIGAQGPEGLQGPEGPQGLIGEQGERGETSERGEQGLQGNAGLQGERGKQGEKGEKGDRGERGSQGSQGIQGIAGPIGAVGLQGERGERSEKGETGDSGVLSVQYPLRLDSRKHLSIDLSKIKPTAPILYDGGGGLGEAFKFISVSGQSGLTAVQYDKETLTLVAGNNITLTTDPNSNSITINSSGGGGTGSVGGITGDYVSGINGLTGALGLTVGGNITLTLTGANNKTFRLYVKPPATVKGQAGALAFADPNAPFDGDGVDLGADNGLKYNYQSDSSFEAPGSIKFGTNIAGSYIEFPDGTTQDTAAKCCPVAIATTGSTGVASFDGDYFNVAATGHVTIRTGIKAGNLIVLGSSLIFGVGGTGALPALDGSALTGVDAKYLQGKTPRQITDGGTF